MNVVLVYVKVDYWTWSFVLIQEEMIKKCGRFLAAFSILRNDGIIMLYELINTMWEAR